MLLIHTKTNRWISVNLFSWDHNNEITIQVRTVTRLFSTKCPFCYQHEALTRLQLSNPADGTDSLCTRGNSDQHQHRSPEQRRTAPMRPWCYLRGYVLACDKGIYYTIQSNKFDVIKATEYFRVITAHGNCVAHPWCKGKYHTENVVQRREKNINVD